MATINIFAPYYFSYHGGMENIGVFVGTSVDFDAIANGTKAFSREDYNALATDKATALLKKKVWDKVHGDEIKSQSMANYIADWYAQAGGLGIRTMQTLVGAGPDGVIGPKTLKSINAKNPTEFFEAARKVRTAMYDGLAKVSAEVQKETAKLAEHVETLRIGALVCRGGWTLEFDDQTYTLKGMSEEEHTETTEDTQPTEVDTQPTATDNTPTESENTPTSVDDKSTEAEDFSQSMAGLTDLMSQLGI